MLFLTSPLMRSPAVRRWQEYLVHEGAELVYGADGWFGQETDYHTRVFQKKARLAPDGIVGPLTWAAMLERIDVDPCGDCKEVSGVPVVDERGTVKPPSNGRHTRDWSEIRGIMLHRTACVLGERPQRWHTVNCHIGVTLSGQILLPHEWELMIWHGNRPSPWTIGIEFDGNPEGLPDGRTYWSPGGGPHPITTPQIKAANVLLDMLFEEFRKHGKEIECVIAHRQSSAGRGYDPGWECWEKIAQPWMEKLGVGPSLENPTKWKGDLWGDGRKIPKGWDDRSPIRRYW